MEPPSAPRIALLAALLVSACHPGGPAAPWLGELRELPGPAASGSRYPHLAGAAPTPVVLSWLQALPDGGFALQHARWRNGSWGPVGSVTRGSDWFINWADFPSVVPLNATTWAAHWLQQRPGGVYAYDVRVAVSDDAGATWSAPMSPHEDGTPTEHGFVTLFAASGTARAVWLDGRHTGGGHDHAGDSGGAMTLRTAAIGGDGRRTGPDLEIDGRVCDCCQTDAAETSEGMVVVYRDRSDHEVRDIALVRQDGDRWSMPAAVHADGWRIDACPVNGPAVDARGRIVAVGWFTAPDLPRVRLAFSDDAGRTFARPIEVARGAVAGRVDVALLDDGRAVVSWIRNTASGAELLAQPFSRDGTAGTAVVVAGPALLGTSGFPQMVRAGDGLLFAWTDSSAPPRVRTVFAPLL